MTIRHATTAPARRLVRVGLALAFAAALVLATPGLGLAAAPAAVKTSPTALRPAPVVAILLTPYLTFEDLSPTVTPALWSLAETGAVGNMNSMTADPGAPTVAGGALTLSASRWAAAAATGPADAASLPAQEAANEGSLSNPTLAALGEALSQAGGITAAVGSSDAGMGAGVVPLRPAELIATDSGGHIDFVDGDTLMADKTAPFGVRADRTRLASAIASALAEIESSPGRGGLLVVDSGDLSRAHQAASEPGADPAQVARARAVALATLDETAAELARQLPVDSLLLVVTPTTTKPYYEPPYLGPVIASGRGLSGSLTSASTHRSGLVTNLDVAPTVLAALGTPAPPSMVGQPFSAGSTALPLAERFASLARAGAAVGAVDKLRDLLLHSRVRMVRDPVRGRRGARRVPPGTMAEGVGPGAAAGGAVRRACGVDRAAPRAVSSLCERSGCRIRRRVARDGRGRDRRGAAGWRASRARRPCCGHGLAGHARSVARRTASDGAVLLLCQSRLALLRHRQRGLGACRGCGTGGGRTRHRLGSPIILGGPAPALCDSGRRDDRPAHRRRAVRRRQRGSCGMGRRCLRRRVVQREPGPLLGAHDRLDRRGWSSCSWQRLPQSICSASGGGTHIGRFFAGFGQDGSGAWELVRRKALNNIGYVTQTPYAWLALAIAAGLALERFVAPRPLARTLERFPATPARSLA